MMLKEKEIGLVLQAIELGNDMAIGKVEVEHSGGEAIVRIGDEFLKCFPATDVFYPSDSESFKDLEMRLKEIGFKPLAILENNTKVMIKSLGVEGIIGDNDLENSEDDLYNLNYYVIPTGKTFDDEIMVHKDDVEVI